jgi:hypothetical protein
VPDEAGLTRLDQALTAAGVRRTAELHAVSAEGAT